MESEFEHIHSDKKSDFDRYTFIINEDFVLDPNLDNKNIKISPKDYQKLMKSFIYASKKETGKLSDREFNIVLDSFNPSVPKPDIDNIPDVDEPEIHDIEDFEKTFNSMINDPEINGSILKDLFQESFDPDNTGTIKFDVWKKLMMDNKDSFTEKEEMDYYKNFAKYPELNSQSDDFDYRKLIDLITKI